MTPEPERFHSARLEDRILSLLSAQPGDLAFNGLRWSLSAHPESLSRALRRLERSGVVLRAEGGYRLAARDPRSSPRAETVRPVAEVELPKDGSGAIGLDHIAGRWFGALRWVGAVDGPSGGRALWAIRGIEGFVSARVENARLIVEVESEDPEVDERLVEGARDLVVQVIQQLRRPKRVRTSAVTTLQPTRDSPAWVQN